MVDKFTVVMGAFDSIQKFGWCHIGRTHQGALDVVKETLEKCGKTYTTHEHKYSTQLFVK